MAEQKIDSDALSEAGRLVREASSHMRGVKHVQFRIDEDTVKIRNRIDCMAECIRKTAMILRDLVPGSTLWGIQFETIREIKQNAVAVHELSWKKKARASYEIYINGDLAKPVVLTRQEWEFLKFLAESRPDPRDGMASTRSLEELVAQFSNGSSRTGNPHKYVNHMVSRIRIALAKQEYDPDFVMRDDRLGVRFAFRGNL
ncbi:MAG: hypothetical protein WBE72_06325 [Terracidiphilus sp.]